MTGIAITTRKDDIATKAERTHFFSKAEIDFLKGVRTVSLDYERVLLYRIFRKLDCFRDEILPILAINQKTQSWVEGITENCNGITDFSNSSHNREKLEESSFSQNDDEIVVGRTGLEPATFCTSSRCPTELDYRP
jgi:hypothetical protein